MKILKVTGAVVSKTAVTLYLEDGEPLQLPKNSYKTKKILEAIMPGIVKHGTASVDIDLYTAERVIEEKSGGLISFFTRTIKKVFGEKEVDHVETVAVVNGKEIPGVEKIQNQIEMAAYGESFKGFSIFMNRLSKIIDQRGHTVQELLMFMESADLPIANDGSIVAYKVLRNTSETGVFVDCYTRKVRQKLGSRVWMPIDKVDQSRRHECSTGLHVARRGYLSGFNADVAVLIKIAPEDVIAVPHGEPNKMRVSAYLIVGVLDAEAYALLLSNKPMTSNEKASRQLGDVITGNHTKMLEQVRIGKPRGEGVKTTKKADAKVIVSGDKAVKALDDVTAANVDIAETNRSLEKLRDAAVSGSMSAAVSAPVKTATPTAKKTYEALSEAEKRREAAYGAVLMGMSQRKAAEDFKVCAKTLRKMIKARSA